MLRIFYLLACCLPCLLHAQTPKAVALYQQATALFEKNQPNEAIDALNKALGESPQYEQALLLRARYFADNDQLEKASQDFTTLVKLSPDKIPYLLERGTFLQNRGDYDAAETDFLQAYQKDSTNLYVLNALGSLYHVADLPEDALKFTNKAIKIDSKNHDAYYTRAWVHCEGKRYAEALADVKVCKDLMKDDVNAQRLEAICYLKQKKYDDVLKIFDSFRDKKVKLLEEDFLYWGTAFYEKGDYKNAVFYLTLPENAAFADLYYYAGKAYFKLNDSKNALQKLDSTLVLLRADNGGVESELCAPVYYDRAIVRQKAGKAKEANDDILQALYLTPEIVAQKDYEGNPLPLLGDAMALLKPKKASVDSIRLKGYQDRAEAFTLSGETNRAWAELGKCDQLDSLHARNAVMKARISLILGKTQDALTHLDKASTLPKGKSDEDIAYYRALVYQERGEFPNAKQAIEKALKYNPQEANYWGLLANIEGDAANPKAALEAVQKAIKLQPQNLDYVLERGMYQQAAGNSSEAIADFSKVIEQEADNAEAYYQRGLAYRALKRYKDALEDFKKAEQYHNDEPELKELIEEMRGK